MPCANVVQEFLRAKERREKLSALEGVLARFLDGGMKALFAAKRSFIEGCREQGESARFCEHEDDGAAVVQRTQ